MSQIDPEQLSKLDSDQQIDLVTDAFLKSWKNGERPSLSEYASLVQRELRDQLLRELILTEQQLQIKKREAEKLPVPTDNSTRTGNPDTAKLQSVMPARIGPYEPQYILGQGASGV